MRDITAQDLSAFLATKADNDVIGKPFSACFCLLANALAWKYDKEFEVHTISGWAGQSYFCLKGPHPVTYCSLWANHLISDFDATFFGQLEEVTKREFLRHFPQYGYKKKG